MLKSGSVKGRQWYVSSLSIYLLYFLGFTEQRKEQSLGFKKTLSWWKKA